MAFIPNTGSTLEKNSDGKFVIRTIGSGTLTDGITYDAINITYPNSTTEIFQYYEGGLSGTLKVTITITYATSDKDDVLTVVKV